jgi:restriction endonuclease S subunit
LTPKQKGQYPVNLKYYFAFFGLMRKNIVQELARGAAKKAINMRNFRALRVPYCPIERQNKIVEEITRRNRVIQSEQDIIEKHRKAIEREEVAIRSMILKSCDE